MAAAVNVGSYRDFLKNAAAPAATPEQPGAAFTDGMRLTARDAEMLRGHPARHNAGEPFFPGGAPLGALDVLAGEPEFAGHDERSVDEDAAPRPVSPPSALDVASVAFEVDWRAAAAQLSAAASSVTAEAATVAAKARVGSPPGGHSTRAIVPAANAAGAVSYVARAYAHAFPIWAPIRDMQLQMQVLRGAARGDGRAAQARAGAPDLAALDPRQPAARGEASVLQGRVRAARVHVRAARAICICTSHTWAPIRHMHFPNERPLDFCAPLCVTWARAGTARRR